MFIVRLPVCLLMLLTTQPQSDAQVAALWRHHWPQFAAHYVKIGDAYLPCAKYNFDYPSSRFEKAEKYTDLHQQTRTITSNSVGVGLTRQQTTRLPREDADAFVRAIPRLAVGEYGYIRGGKAARIEGPDQMILTDIQLIDVDQLTRDKNDTARSLARRGAADSRRELVDAVEWRYQKRDELVELQNDKSWQVPVRVVGFDTTRLKEDEFWTGQTPHHQRDGVQLAIVGTAEVESSKSSRRRSRTVTVLVAVDALRLRRRELKEDDFKALLAARGFDEASFVELVLREKQRDPENADVEIIKELEAGKQP